MKKPITALTAVALAIALSATGFAEVASAAAGTSVAQLSASARTERTPARTPVKCLPQSAVSYVYDRPTATARLVVAAPEGMASTILCHPIYIRAATWHYLLPTTGKTPSYPQRYVDSTYLTVAGVGSFELTAPAGSGTCEQHDFYASYSNHELEVPAVLTAPHAPWEPTFLSELLGGRGPATYDADSSLGCEPSVVPPVTVPVRLLVADPTSTDQTCSAAVTGGTGPVDGAITVDLGTAGPAGTTSGTSPGATVEYSITTPSKTVLAHVGRTTTVAPGDYVVTAQAASGFTLPRSSWTLTVLAHPVLCTTAVTPTPMAAAATGTVPTRGSSLAATGVSDPTAGFLGLAGALLLLGLGGIVYARRRARS